MKSNFINLTTENIQQEHLCCIIRTKKFHHGINAKKQWLNKRLNEGHVFRKLNEKATVFIEYAPLETAWVPIKGENYLYLYCLWVLGDYKRKGYGSSLLAYCINDAKAKGKSGICMLGAQKQKSWLSDQTFAKKNGFKTVDKTNNGYELLALSFDESTPYFPEKVKNPTIENKELTIYYSMQCPFVFNTIKKIKQYCTENNIPHSLYHIDTLQKAKELPCVFNNWAVFYKGIFETVNLLDIKYLERILKK